MIPKTNSPIFVIASGLWNGLALQLSLANVVWGRVALYFRFAGRLSVPVLGSPPAPPGKSSSLGEGAQLKPPTINLNGELGRIPSDFFTHVEKSENGCWNWTGYCQFGYGVMGARLPLDGKKHFVRAHRISYRIHYGAVPTELDLHHTCENKRCVRPDHLKPVTKAVHMADLTPKAISYVNKRKTHCKRGHPYSGSNLRTSYTNPNWRLCRACTAIYRSTWLAKRDAALKAGV